MRSTSRDTLEKARLFLTQAEQAIVSEQRFRVIANLEAAIIYGRSVTFHIQSEYTHRPGFKSWYNSHQEAMKNDALCRFMVNMRNEILKEKSAKVGRRVSLSTSIHGFTVTSNVEARVIRGQPWYRRSLRIIWQDVYANVTRFFRKLIHKWRQRRAIAQKRAEAQRQAEERKVVVDDSYYFSDVNWRNRPACEFVSEYLNKLEIIVNDAETHFGNSS